MSKRDRHSEEEQPKPIRANAVLDVICVGLRKIATEDGTHVSSVKEEMVAFWKQLNEDERREHAPRLLDAIRRISSSLESLKQEFEIASVKDRI